MKRFLLKSCVFFVVPVVVVIGLAVLVPPDRNGYLMAYHVKLARLDSCPSPRIIFVGGSNLAFGLDSRAVEDSLHLSVVNMGLHGGVGFRLPMEDVAGHVRRGDMVVMQIEYGNFFSGGNGEPETIPQFMAATHWRFWGQLNARQTKNVLAGMPRLAASNLKRLLRAACGGSFHSTRSDSVYRYVASGFNNYGDEVSHWHLSPSDMETSSLRPPSLADDDFLSWLNGIIIRCERRGVTVVMLPPVCPKSHFEVSYNPVIAHCLDSIGHPYFIDPHDMVVPDSMSYNGGYHVNHAGVTLNTARIIAALEHY